MQAPRLPRLFNLFRQRGPKGFDFATRYYDAEKEAREERRKRALESGGDPRLDRELLAKRMRHSWQRQHQGKGLVQRYLLTMGLVAVVLFLIIKAYGLVQF